MRRRRSMGKMLHGSPFSAIQESTLRTNTLTHIAYMLFTTDVGILYQTINRSLNTYHRCYEHQMNTYEHL